MMIEDKLTRAERIRLESLNQVRGMSSIMPDNIEEILKSAERVEQWLRQAREDA